jgi:hypothetical protein
MSSEFERLLRKGQAALPEPEAGVTRRARQKALAAILRRRRLRLRSPLTLAAALAAAVGVGIGVGALVTPSSTAAPRAMGLGFLPEQGWSVHQAGTRATVARPASAIATNVSIHPDDFVHGRPDPSQLPYTTLLRLPRNGVVIVADFTLLREHSVFTGQLFRPRELPLKLRDASPLDQFGTQIRPRRPLGQYQLRAAVNGYAVDLAFYFGTARPSQALLASAQRQLERLVVERPQARPRVQPPRTLAAVTSAPAGSTAARLIDRTFRCNLGIVAGTPKIEVSAAAGTRARGNRRFDRLAQATVITFPENNFREADSLNVAGMTAGWPPPVSVPTGGGMGISLDQCTPVVASVPLRTRGLNGGRIDSFEDTYECFPLTRRILLRTRSLFRRPTNLRLRRGPAGERDLATVGRITEGVIAARTANGKPILYTQIFESGKARLFTEPDCVPDPT